ncbi:hypothetical protein YIM730264_11740 [Thermus hydrothermalis]
MARAEPKGGNRHLNEVVKAAKPAGSSTAFLPDPTGQILWQVYKFPRLGNSGSSLGNRCVGVGEVSAVVKSIPDSKFERKPFVGHAIVVIDVA